MQVISGVNNSAFFAQSAYSASTAGYDVNGYPITSYLPESGVGYNAVNEISALNGSAIAQYGHEAQWLLHDDTLVHASNSAQYALGVNLSAVAQLLGGIDETVLWTGSMSPGESATLSESVQNFDRIKFKWADWDSTKTLHISECGIQKNTASYYSLGGTWHGNTSSTIVIFKLNCKDNGDKIMTFNHGSFMSTTGTTINPANQSRILEIRGIGRKANT